MDLTYGVTKRENGNRNSVHILFIPPRELYCIWEDWRLSICQVLLPLNELPGFLR